MGSFINSPNDSIIVAALNNRFSDAQDPHADAANPDKTMIGSVRFLDGKEGGLLFSRKLNLARLAYRLGGVPPATDPQSRRRWFFLLRRMLPHATKVAISAVLEAVMGDSTIKQVHFDLIHDSSITHEFELDPGNSQVPHTTAFASTAHPAVTVKTCMMLLRCFYDEPLPDPNPAFEVDPPKAQNPEAQPTVLP
jgi:hypothetical protein